MKNLKWEIRALVNDQIRNQIDPKIGEGIWREVSDLLGHQIEDQVWVPIWRQFNSHPRYQFEK